MCGFIADDFRHFGILEKIRKKKIWILAAIPRRLRILGKTDIAMTGENRQLVTNEPVEFDK